MSQKYNIDKNDNLICDFTKGSVKHRLIYGGGRNQSLPRAVGMTKGRTPNIVDATAGLGKDSFLLASLGARVTLIERSPEIHGLLLDGMSRAIRAGGITAEIVGRMTLIMGDSIDLLLKLKPEVVLVDPMHPARNNSALVKKEMILVRQIVGNDSDCADLMRVALSVATKRVVLKWPKGANAILNIQLPSHQLSGKTTRYDVFMIS